MLLCNLFSMYQHGSVSTKRKKGQRHYLSEDLVDLYKFGSPDKILGVFKSKISVELDQIAMIV